MGNSNFNFIRIILGLLVVSIFFIQRKCASDREAEMKRKRQEMNERFYYQNPDGPFKTYDPFIQQKEEFRRRMEQERNSIND
jgi:hypothetical protein